MAYSSGLGSGGGQILSVYRTKYFMLRRLLIVDDEPESEFENCLHGVKGFEIYSEVNVL